MRYANIRKASQDEQQNQTTTTSINFLPYDNVVCDLSLMPLGRK